MGHRGACLCQSSRPLPSSWASGHVSSASEHVKDRVSGGRAAALPSSHTDWHPWCPAPLSVLSRLLPPAQDPLGGRRRRAQPRLASRVKEGVPAPAGRWGDGAGCCPHQQPPPGAPSALRLAPSPCTWQGHRLPQRGGRGQLLLGAKPRGAQSHIPRCRPRPPSTSILLSTSGNAALYAPPASSLSPARSSLGCRVEETGDLHPLGTEAPLPAAPRGWLQSVPLTPWVILLLKLPSKMVWGPGPSLSSLPSFYLCFCLQIGVGSSTGPGQRSPSPGCQQERVLARARLQSWPRPSLTPPRTTL